MTFKMTLLYDLRRRASMFSAADKYHIIKAMKQTVVLIILDGWGIGRNDESNPIHVVDPQYFKWMAENYPVTSLQASGISVGLPWGEVGNSEVGHLTIGAGKVIYQYYPRITIAIRDKSFFEIKALKDAFAHAKQNNSGVNLVGLLSKGNVHAALDHLLALIEMAKQNGVDNVKLHLFADGKDGPPKTLESFLSQLPKDKLASLVGRYYAMDREGNWNLTQQAYDCMTGKAGSLAPDPTPNIKMLYAKNLNEEFLPPLRVDPAKAIQSNDAVIFFNYREDSIRQLAQSFIDKNFDKFPKQQLDNLYIATMTRYKEEFNVPVAFPPDEVKKPLGKVLSDAGKTQLRLAETYKYAHITYFFNGYEEPPFKNEYRVLIPSESIPHPDEHPAMMAPAITDRLLQSLEGHAFDFILVNYANPDTIAHTGNNNATQEAVRAIDKEIGRILQVALNPETILIITSDHGHAEELINPVTGEMETQHAANPVPFYLIADKFKGRKFSNYQSLAQETMGILSDVAPTILELMGIEKPAEMNGESLLKGLL